MPQCSYRFSNRSVQCSESSIEGGAFCLFHDPNVWEIQEKEILEGIERKLLWEDYNFEGYHFPEIDFSKFTFNIPVSFQNAVFHSSVKFSGASFNEVTFRGAKFIGRAYFNKCQFSGKAFFDDVEFIKRAFFKSAQFQNAFFNKTIFSELTFFRSSRFENGFFSNARFLNGVRFNDSKFRNVYFRGVTFSGANFRNTLFIDRVNFRDTLFSKEATFSSAIFSGKSNFKNVTFKKSVAFNKTHFIEQTDFSNSRFTIGEFENTKFSESVSFNNSYNINEDDTRTFWRANFTNAIFEKNTSFKDAYLDPCFESTSMEFSDLRDIMWPKDKKLYNERKADTMVKGIQKMIQYQKATRTYFFLRKSLRAEGDFVDEADFFYRERLSQKKLLGIRKHFWFKKTSLEEGDTIKSLCGGRPEFESCIEWLWLWITQLTCGFGERIFHVVSIFFITWLLSAFFLFISTSNFEISWDHIHKALYMSLGALSNMGFDNNLALSLQPLGHWVIQVEALFGIILTSLFLVVFVRKMSRQ